MSEFSTLIKNLLQGQPIGLASLLLLFCALFLYKILGKYLEEWYFSRFPIKNQKSIIASLRKEILREIAIREEAQRLAIRAIKQSHAYHAEIIKQKRLVATLRREIIDLNSTTSQNNY